MKSVGKIKKIAKPLAKEKFYINTQFALYYNKLRSLRSIVTSFQVISFHLTERSDYFVERSDY